MLKHLRTLIVVTGISTGMATHAGTPGEATMEPTIVAPETFDPPQGSVNGGYALLGAFAITAIISAGS